MTESLSAQGFSAGVPTAIAIAPGRVNLIGEHTDYNEGFVLPVAIDRTVTAGFSHRDDRVVRALSVDLAQSDEFSLDRIEPLPSHSWANYVRGVASTLQNAGYRLTGLEIVIHGNIPIGTGLSSSAALEVAVLGAMQSAAGLRIAPKEQALLAQRAENEFVGVACGIMDQMAAVMGRRGHALFVDCRSLDVEMVPLRLEAEGLLIVVAETGIPRNLTDSAFNRRREECTRAVRLLSSVVEGKSVTALRDLTEDDLERWGTDLPEPLYRRARHVVTENERVLRTVTALRNGDFGALGGLLRASHESLRDDYEVSSPELDLMVEMARDAGVAGARMTGAGFGGCTVNLVREESIDGFRAEVIERYRARTGLPGEMHVCRSGDGLRVLAAANSA